MAVTYIPELAPERICPGTFDTWLQSHRIFHVTVVAAASVHICWVPDLQEFRYGWEAPVLATPFPGPPTRGWNGNFPSAFKNSFLAEVRGSL